MKQYRICQLDGCDVWRLEVFAAPIWPLRLFMAPRWRPVYESFGFDYPTQVVERKSHIDAVVTREGYERRDREAAARKANYWSRVGV